MQGLQMQVQNREVSGVCVTEKTGNKSVLSESGADAADELRSNAGDGLHSAQRRREE